MDDFIKDLDFTGGKYRAIDIFSDLIKITAFYILGYVLEYNTYKSEIDELLKKYNKEEINKLGELFARLILMFDNQREIEYKDILGIMFHKINANSKVLGQFFTPPHLQKACSDLIVTKEQFDEKIKKDGYVKMIEPSCGSGGMIVSMAQTIKEYGYEPEKTMLVRAIDLDLLCTYMCYVQLSLYDIPAIVINGDTLANDENLRYYTPQYFFGNWCLK